MTPDPAILQQKDQLRAGVRAALTAMDPAELVAQSIRACKAFIESDQFARARTILLYAPADDEPNLSSIASAAASEGKVIGVPDVEWTKGTLHPKAVHDLGPSLVKGKYGIRVPGASAPELPPESIDLVVTPGVAFDRSGGRLGRGAGFYDRFLNNPRLRADRVAIVLRPQLVPHVPTAPHDVRIHTLFTPDGVFFCGTNPSTPDGSDVRTPPAR